MNMNYLIYKKERNDLLFCKLALKFNTKSRLSSLCIEKINYLDHEIETYIFLIILEEIQASVSKYLITKIQARKKLLSSNGYIFTLIVINCLIKLNLKFVNIFSENYSKRLYSNSISTSFFYEESYFVKELLNYLTSALNNDSDQFIYKTFVLVLENLVLKIGKNLIDLYIIQQATILKNNQSVLLLDLNEIFYITSIKKFLYEVFFKIKNIHNNIYPVLIIHRGRFFNKNIFYPRFKEKENLSFLQKIILNYFQLIDWIKDSYRNLKLFQKNNHP